MLQLDVVTPERILLSEPVTHVRAPGITGSFGILNNHAPLVTELGVGELRYRSQRGDEHRMAVSGGFLQVSENHVTVLADTAERAEEIDVDRARRALERARTERASAGEPHQATDAQAAADRALNRLRVAGQATL